MVEITYQYKAWVNWIKKSPCAEKVDRLHLQMEKRRPPAPQKEKESGREKGVVAEIRCKFQLLYLTSCVTEGRLLDFSGPPLKHAMGNSMREYMY